MPAETALAAYQAYQETMRQFLTVQEQVMRQFLGATQTGYVPQVRNGAISPANGHNAIAPANSHNAISPANGHTVSASTNGVNGHNAIALTNGTSNGYSSNIAPVKELISSPSVVVSPPPVTPVTAMPVAPLVMNREALTEILLKLVSDRTGYPPQMLGLDQDMEAELGIDSI